jgi:hypothetical protein
VIDTQLFLRATLNPKSLPARMLFQMRNLYFLAVSKEVRAEVENVLNRPELRARFPQLTDEAVSQTLALLDQGRQTHVEDIPRVSRDPKDDIFLALAVTSKAQYIVSEDNDLLVLDPYGDIRIINALAFVNIFQGKTPTSVPEPSE